MPVGLYVQGPGGTALAAALEGARGGADPIAAATYPVAVPTHRASSELLCQALAGIGLDSGVDQAAAWDAALLVDHELGSGEALPPPLSAHVSLLAAVNRVPAGPRGQRRAPARAAGRVRPAAGGAGRGRAGARGARPPAHGAAGGADHHAPGHRPRALRPALGRHVREPARDVPGRVGADAGPGVAGRARAGRGAGADGGRDGRPRGGPRGGRQARGLRGGAVPRRALRGRGPAADRARAQPPAAERPRPGASRPRSRASSR